MKGPSVLILVKRAPGDEPRSVWMWCPGCQDQHRIVLDATAGWAWNGIEDEPTFTPSILVQGGSNGIRCHSFVTDGSWQFLSDSTHAFSGQTVPMVPIPDDVLSLIGAF